MNFRYCVHLHPGNPVNSPLGECEVCPVRKNRNLQSNFVHSHPDLGLHIHNLGSAILWIWFLCSRIIWHLVRKLCFIKKYLFEPCVCRDVCYKIEIFERKLYMAFYVRWSTERKHGFKQGALILGQ